MKYPVIIGLTGPIASGKSLAAAFFARRGGLIIDADKIGHDVLAPQSKEWKQAVKAFGSGVLNRGGVMNRNKLAGIVFSDRNALRKLNRITHPAILQRAKAQISAAKKKARKFIVVDAALLREIGLIPLVDKVIVILSSKEKRIRRSLSEGRSRNTILRMMSAQGSDSSYRKGADIVINNNGTKKQFIGILKGIVSKIG